MPRQSRIEFPDAIYHVMARGDRREPIVLDDLDRQRFLATLCDVCAKTGWRVFAWVLMDNQPAGTRAPRRRRRVRAARRMQVLQTDRPGVAKRATG